MYKIKDISFDLHCMNKMCQSAALAAAADPSKHQHHTRYTGDYMREEEGGDGGGCAN